MVPPLYKFKQSSIGCNAIIFKGCNQKSIFKDDLFSIKIPIPSIEKQNEIVEYLDLICNKNIKSNDNIKEIQKLKLWVKYLILNKK